MSHKKNNEIIVESEKRLSQSMLWNLQTAAYLSFGADAWSKKGVPSYITSNPFIAEKYAQLVIGYIRDGLAQKTLDPLHPIYIFDLGAGTGRFGYSFLRSFQKILTYLDALQLNFCYVMTDFTEGNLRFLQNHPYLKKYIDSGVLDFALYQHNDLKPLKLFIQKKELLAENFKNPAIVIANYFFDTIPQDLFRIQQGVIEEGHITLSVPDDDETRGLKPIDPAIIMHLIPHYTYAPIDDLQNYYKEPAFNEILVKYLHRLKNVSFNFSTGAFQVIDYFRKFSNKGMLLIAADQGACTEEDLQSYRDPYVSKHGSFSIPVNYDAIGKYFEFLGGKTLITEFRDPTFVVTVSLLGQGGDSHYRETELAFQNHINAFGPSDYFELVTFSDQEWSQPNLEKMLMLLKLGIWDPSNFNEFFERIRKEAVTAPGSMKEKVRKVIFKVWDEFYPVNPQEALFVMNLGVLLFDLKYKDDALLFFQRALEINEKDPLVLKNLASCYRSMGKLDLAKEHLRKALE